MKIKVKNFTYQDTMNKIHIGEDTIECCNKYLTLVGLGYCEGYNEEIYECECGNQITVKIEEENKE